MKMRVLALAATLVLSCAVWSLQPSSETTLRPQWRDVSAFKLALAGAGGLHAVLHRRHSSQRALQLLQVTHRPRRAALEAYWEQMLHAASCLGPLASL